MATKFQQSVWEALDKIPKGKLVTYKMVADYLGTGAVRAVGTAVGKNPNAPMTPCHRVVRSDGKIGEYSGVGGVRRKIEFLREEGIFIEGDRVVDFEEKLWGF